MIFSDGPFAHWAPGRFEAGLGWQKAPALATGNNRLDVKLAPGTNIEPTLFFRIWYTF